MFTDKVKILVKYLDKEDIEELGWKFLNKNSLNENIVNFVYKKDGQIIYYMNFVDSTKIMIRNGGTFQINKNIEKMVLTITEEVKLGMIGHFLRLISNKSELKKLMQQLGII